MFLRQEFWSLSFEDQREYGLDIPRRLHIRGNIKQQKYLTMPCVDICEIFWYKIIGVSRSTYMLHKFDNK